MSEPNREPCENCGAPLLHVLTSTHELVPDGEDSLIWQAHTPERCRAIRRGDISLPNEDLIAKWEEMWKQ